MKKSVLAACLIGLALCVFLVLLKHRAQVKSSTSIALPPQIDTQSTPPSPTITQQIVPAPGIPPLSSNATVSSSVPPPSPMGDSNTVDPRLLAAWQVPITFYGRVIDQNSNPVVGAHIHLRWSEKPTADGMRMTDTSSDSQGLFSFTGAVGRSLTVYFSKEGYDSSKRGQQTFNYALGPDIYSPDPQNPTILNLYKKGQVEALIFVKQNYRVSPDGSPLSIDLTTGQSSGSDSGNFVVRCLTQNAGKQSGEKYDWDCHITIPGGGMVPINQEFAYSAPETGYSETTEIAMPTDRPDWSDNVDLNFYFRLADGRYGKMKFSMITGGHHFCMIDSVLNPSGSRNLEPAQ